MKETETIRKTVGGNGVDLTKMQNDCSLELLCCSLIQNTSNYPIKSNLIQMKEK